MHIELGPAASHLLQTQAKAADMTIASWVEHLAVEQSIAQGGSRPAAASVEIASGVDLYGETIAAILNANRAVPARGQPVRGRPRDAARP